MKDGGVQQQQTSDDEDKELEETEEARNQKQDLLDFALTLDSKDLIFRVMSDVLTGGQVLLCSNRCT